MRKASSVTLLVFLTAIIAIVGPVDELAELGTCTVDHRGSTVFRKIQDATDAVDKTPPTISIRSPRELASPGYIVRVSSLHVVWSAWDATSGVAYYETRLDDGGWTRVGFMGTHSPYAEFTFTDLNDGLHNIDIKAVDNAGNVRQERYEFLVDTLLLRIATVIVIFAAVVAVGYGLSFLRKRYFSGRNEAPHRLVR